MFGSMELGRNSEEKLEPSMNRLRKAFYVNFYGFGNNIAGHIPLKSRNRMSLNFQNGIMMVPALVKLGMKIVRSLPKRTHVRAILVRKHEQNSAEKLQNFHLCSQLKDPILIVI